MAKQPPNHMGPPRPLAWLWHVAFWIALIAGVWIYFLRQQPATPENVQLLRVVACLAALGIGVCVIAATSRFWLHR